MCFDTRVHSRFFLTLPRSPWAKMMLSCIYSLIFVWVAKADFFLHLLVTRTIGTEKIATESASEKRRRMEWKSWTNLFFILLQLYSLAGCCRSLLISAFILLGANQLIWIVFMNKSPESQGFDTCRLSLGFDVLLRSYHTLWISCNRLACPLLSWVLLMLCNIDTLQASTLVVLVGL